jgi:glutathione S-transferase
MSYHILGIVLEPREELRIPYTLLPALPRSSDVLTLNPAGKVPILKAGRLWERKKMNS